VRQRHKRLMYDNTRTNNCIHSINKLSASAMIKPRTNVPHIFNAKPLPLSTSTHLQQHIRQSSVRYNRLLYGSADVSAEFEQPISSVHINIPNISLALPGRGYTDDVAALMINTKCLSLPTVAATANIIDLLSDNVAEIYKDPTKLLRPSDKVKRAPHAFMCTHDEYPSLIKQLHTIGMLTFISHQPKAINGIFAVAKDTNKQRLILDARPANALFIDAPGVALPSPEIFCELKIPTSEELFVAKCDLDNYYHRLRMPESWWEYFALPAVRAGDVSIDHYPADSLIYPCLVTLPMGFSHAVYLAQDAHLNIINQYHIMVMIIISHMRMISSLIVLVTVFTLMI
jgi:hypothetical protein